MTRDAWRWTALVGANVLLWCLFGWHQGIVSAQPQGAQPPFANPIDQRNEMIRGLQETNSLLREQLALLRSGKLQVVVVDKK